MKKATARTRKGPEKIPAGAIVGSYQSTSSDFVGHVAILMDEVLLEELGLRPTKVTHVRPPLICEQDRFDIACWVQDLDPERSNSITHIATLAVTTTKCRYVVHPAFVEMRDKETNVLRVLLASCSGFVLWCYLKGAEVTLVDWNDHGYPVSTLAELAKNYGQSHDSISSRCGDGSLSCAPIVLPGHLLHAAESGTLPFMPKQEHQNYPRSNGT